MGKVYGQTWADVGVVPRDISWRGIRALRAQPPGQAGGNRHATFSTALEQAEQLFRAAATVTAAARPLPLFYGLSQAGRALVASRATNSWHISGHGIREHRSSNRRGAPVADFHVEAVGNGAFRMVADALGSSGLATPTRLGDLWPLLPEARRFALPGMGDARLLDVRIQTMERDGLPFHGTIQGLPACLAEPRTPSIAGVRDDWDEERDRVATYLSKFPSLSGYQFTIGRGQPIGLRPTGDNTAEAEVWWPTSATGGITTVAGWERRLTYRYASYRNAYPSLDGSPRPIHPLLVWWAVLYGLSILARYEPESWGFAIDVNRSQDAVPIEHVLEAALDTVPELLHRTLDGDL